MRLSSILFLLLLSACTKSVYTVYYEDKNHTIFTTHKLKITTPNYHDLFIEASKICPGKTLCVADEIKFELKQQSRFAFLKGKDFYMKTDKQIIDLNHRNYRFDYDINIKAKDGTTGVAFERWLVWVSNLDFNQIANSEKLVMTVGEHDLAIEKKLRDPWSILLDHTKLLETMDNEQKRAYGKYTKAPVTEAEMREKFEKKANIEAEETTWNLVKESNDIGDLIYFLEKYPDSPFAVPAQLRLKQLKRNQK